jgi:thioredoxin 1
VRPMPLGPAVSRTLEISASFFAASSMLLRSSALRAAARHRHVVVTPAMVFRRSLATKVLTCEAEDDFDKAKATAGGSVVYFTASWCGPCRMISPVFDELAASAADGSTFLKVDVDDQPDVAAAAGVTAMPTFQFFKGGKLVDKIVGADVQKLQTFTTQHLS